MRWLALSVLALSLACGSDSVTNTVPEVNAVGTWQLESIGGQTLPYLLVSAGDDKLELMEAALEVSAGGSFNATSTERTTISGIAESQSYIDPGHFTMDGSIISFTFDSDGSVAHGTIAGNTLTFSGDSPVVYRRK